MSARAFDEDGGDESRIAWRDFDNRRGRPGRWSRLHRTADGGKTTLCGLVVPGFYDADPHGNGDVCQRCTRRRKRAEGQGRS